MRCASERKRSMAASTQSCSRQRADLGQRHAHIGLVVRILQPDRHDALGPTERGQRFPVAGGLERLGANAGTGRRIAQILQQPVALGGPRRQDRSQAGAPGDVRIEIGRDIETFLARPVDSCDGLRHLGPVALACSLEMIDLNRHPGGLGQSSMASSSAARKSSASERKWVM